MLGKIKTSFPKWWFNGHLPLYKIKHHRQIHVFDGNPNAKPVSSEKSSAFSPGNDFELSYFFKKTAVSLFFLEAAKNPPKKKTTAEVFLFSSATKKVNPMQGRLEKLHGRLGAKHLQEVFLEAPKDGAVQWLTGATILTASWIFCWVKRFTVCNSCMYIYIYKYIYIHIRICFGKLWWFQWKLYKKHIAGKGW